MFKNHVLLIIRNAWRYRGYTAINMVGLAVGVACCLLIALFVYDEWATDRFHEGAERIYQVTAHNEVAGYYFGAPYALENALLHEATHTAHIAPVSFGGTAVVQQEQTVTEVEGVYRTTSAFFELFAFPLAEGHAATALDAPGTVVLSQQLADLYFPNGPALGQLLRVDGEDRRVTGVAAPPPGNSFLDVQMLLSLDVAADQATSWNPGQTPLYVRLKPGRVAADLEADLAHLHAAHLSPTANIAFHAMPLTDLYFEWRSAGSLTGNRQYLWVFAAIAVLVLLIACVNYMNLATAQASRYAREVGVRKAVGARRGQLVARFLSESLLIAAGALVLAFGLAELALPTFNHLTEKSLALPYATDGRFWVAVVALALGTGLAAGSYPALYLSTLKPMQVLKGQPREAGSRVWVRKGLVVFQFTITVVFVVSTFVVRQQLDFLQTRNLGLNPEQVVALELGDGVRSNLESFKQEAAQLPGVVDLAIGNPLRTGQLPITPEGGTDEDERFISVLNVDPGFVSLLDIEVVAGRAFDANLASDVEESILLNEAAARQLGWHGDAVGRTLERYNGDFERVTSTVVGVVGDFNFRSLHAEVQPLMLQLHEQRQSTALLKVQPEHTVALLAGLEALHVRFAPEQPFAYSFLDERFEAFYRSEERLGQIFGFFAGLAIVVACLGLFGLAAFLAEQRTKEIGIRKVLGASAQSLLVLLTRDFIVLVGVAIVVATPLAYVLMTQWLADFAYRVDLGLGVFMLAGLLALSIALLTVSYQAAKVARANPIEALRYE